VRRYTKQFGHTNTNQQEFLKPKKELITNSKQKKGESAACWIKFYVCLYHLVEKQMGNIIALHLAFHKLQS
jgi:hypothetical protein